VGGIVFISYRRKDAAGTAGRLFDRLEQHFSRDQLFFDVDNIPPGEDFVAHLHTKVDACDVLLAVVGPNWRTLLDTREHDPGKPTRDFVRVEIEAALSKGKRIIPVLVKGAEMPREEDLPAAMQPFARRNAVRLSHERFKADAEALAKTLKAELSGAGTHAHPPPGKSKGSPTGRSLTLITGLLVVALAGASAAALWPRLLGPPAAMSVPQWTFKNRLFIGEPIPLRWSYHLASADQAVCYEIQSARDELFRLDNHLESCPQSDHYYIRASVNGTRYFRVHAVDYQTRKTISDWSAPVKVTQYDSVYDRIRTTGQLHIYMSDAQDQDVFKWEKNKGVQGVDIMVAQLILRDLPAPKGLRITPAKWNELLPAVKEGKADFVISTLTRTLERERKFHVVFSEPYFCTTYALMYRVGTQDAPIRSMIAGKTVGAQLATTDSRLAKVLLAEMIANGSRFELKNDYANTEDLVQALHRGEVDFILVDTAFAYGAQLKSRQNRIDRLDFTEFARDDMPKSMQDEYAQKYGVAFRNDEKGLGRVINDSIARAKRDGSLARVYKEATEEFEDTFKQPRGSRSLGRRPWQCSGSDETEDGVVAR